MHFLACFWILLCLVFDTSTKSLSSTNEETDIADFLDSLDWKADGNLTAEQCKCENGFCKQDNNGKSVCICPPEWGLYSSTECKKCDCGKNANCTFTSTYYGIIVEKTCICEVGYENRNKFCIGTCKENPCLNGGSCRLKGKDIECKCKQSFAGEKCEEKVWCNETEGCQNGGSCRIIGDDRFCKCKVGTEGPYCEIVPECSQKNCGPDALCVYNIHSSKAVCQCKNDSLSFDPINGRCKMQCNETESCKNGGRCSKIGEDSFCRCKARTKGTYCEIVPECTNMNCGTDADCVYEIQSQKAVCQCRDNSSFSFDPVDERCKLRCNQTHVCENGGVCSQIQGDGFCRCRNGTAGDFCNIVSECIDKNCGTDAKCMYDVQSEKAVCHCPDSLSYSFDPVDERCKMRCNKTHVCGNGGVCSATHGDGFCRCRNGTEGDFCYTVSKCIDKKCGRDAECVYEVQSEKAVCQCRDESLSFDPMDERCKLPCKESEDCRNGGWCSKTDEESFCRCRTGTLGDFCNVVTECSNKNCGKDAECVYEVQSEKAVCHCRDNRMSFDPDDKRCKRDGCLPNPCLNDGICNATEENVMCHCKDRFRGADCSIDVCSPNPCQNGGICNATKGEVTCQCKVRFRGADCSVDVCSPNPCLNDGVCNATREGVVCRCTERFRGADCSIEIPFLSTSMSEGTSNATPNFTILPTDYPTSSPSDHSLNFTVGGKSTFPFTTIPPTTGVDPCTENPCQNGGTCVVVENRPKCLCKKPYLGNLCETDPCDWNPCKNGGVCKIENETFGCYCKTPFTGKLCESQTKTDTYVITLDAVSVFLAILLVFLICRLCLRYQTVRSN